MQAAEVIVSMRGGETLREYRNDLIPATAAEVQARFRVACGEPAAALEARIAALEDQDDVGILSALVQR